MSELIKVPTFTFNQGDPFMQDGLAEAPIQVSYYDNCISLMQEGRDIVLQPGHVANLFKNIKKHKPEADKFHAKKNK